MKNIELEFRAEIRKSEEAGLESKLKRFSKKLVSRRLSVMHLGEIGNKKYDIRVRVDSLGNSEVVLKKGHFHTHDREEYSVKINKTQIIPFVQIFSAFGFETKVTERVNELYNLRGGIKLVWVKAKHISYVELEKMTDKAHKDEDGKKLTTLMGSIGIRKINKNQFNDLCDRLTKEVDFVFKPGKKDFQKVTRILEKYMLS